MSATISNLTPAPVRRRGNGCGDGGRAGGGVRRIYHLSSRLTVLPLSAGLCACLKTGETRARLGAAARQVVVVPSNNASGGARRTPSFNKAGVIASWRQTNGLSQDWLQDRRRGSAQARVLAERATAPTRPLIIFGIAARDVQPDPRGRSFRVPIAWDCAPGGQSPSGFRICADAQSRLRSALRQGRYSEW